MRNGSRLSCFFAVCIGVFCLASRILADTALSSADALFAQNKFAQARESYALQLQKHPDDPTASVGLMRSLLRLDHWTEAVTAGQAAVKQFPDNADLHGLMALAWMRAGQPDQAQKEAQQALQQDKTDYWGLVASARINGWNSHWQTASSLAAQAIQERPAEPEAWLERFLLVGDTEKTKQEALQLAAQLIQSKPLLTAKGHPFEGVAQAAKESQSFFAAELKYFVTDLPFQAVAPLSEQSLKDFDQGSGSFSLTFPVERLEGTLLIPVIIDGQSFKLLFDTGGQDIITLNASAARRLHLTPLSSLTIQGVSGKETTTLIKASRLTLGASSGLTFRSIPLHVLSRDQQKVDGTFGGAILHKYCVTLDLKSSRMTLTRGKPVLPSASSLAVPLHQYRGGLYLPLQSGGSSFWAFLDTGASFNVASMRLAQKLAVGVPTAQVTRGSTAGLTSFGVTAHKLNYLTLDKPISFTFLDQSATFQEPDVTGLSALDGQISPSLDFEQSLIVGMPFLSHYQASTIDYPNRVLYLMPDDGTAELVSDQTSSVISADKAIELNVNGKSYSVTIPPDSHVTVHTDGRVTLDSPGNKSETVSPKS